MPPRYRRPRSDDRPMSGTAAVAPNPAKRPKTEAPVPPAPVVERAASPASSKHFTDRTFKDASLTAASKAAIKHEFMSDVQAATIDLGLAGKDLLVQAKTGTGKTIAFLLPVIERLAKDKRPHNGVQVLVLAPTRELAMQIEKEALMLVKHHTGMTVGSVMGGNNPNKSLAMILQTPPTILVATPGRLHDHLTTPDHAAEVQRRFATLQGLVYDEADRLLDQGFRRELDGILSALPRRHITPRQVMLFSATISAEIREVGGSFLLALGKCSHHGRLQRGHLIGTTSLCLHCLRMRSTRINMASPVACDIKLRINATTVPQTHVVAPFIDAFPLALRILRQDRVTNALPTSTPAALSASGHTTIKPASKSKVIIFFPTARHVSLAAELLHALPGIPPVFELHSRLSQSARTRANTSFDKAVEGVLVSSDVAARGVDFPGVTLVLQLGLPSSTEQYIHRLGRTARAGTAGKGMVVLSPEEAAFLNLRETKALGIKPDPAANSADLAKEHAEVAAALKKSVGADVKAQAYRAWLGYYKAHLRLLKWTREELVQQANAYAYRALGWEDEKPPGLDPKTVGRMTMKGVVGLNIVRAVPIEKSPGGGGNGRQGQGRRDKTPREELRSRYLEGYNTPS
ncbi:hypothetical protein DXG01_005553 [Tephrocybe rancida]|nr:hypothetical protein DXG01_005553 [Tephrocybe rancida]